MPVDRRWRAGLAMTALTAVLATGCAAQSTAEPQASSSVTGHPGSTSHEYGSDRAGDKTGDEGGDHDMTGMSDEEMAGMHMSANGVGPSAPAAMICSKEIRDSVRRSFTLSSLPQPSSSFQDGIFTCTYDVPQGELVLSVDDATDKGAGKRYFQDLAGSLPGAHPIKGVEGFGLPNAENDANVVFLRDGKTLRVDATGLPSRVKPYGFTRSHVAYAVAASVIACWTE